MKIIDVIQGSEKWDQLRSQVPTASEYGKIFTGGGKPSLQREGYMRRLSVSAKYSLPSFQGNDHTDRGHELEPEARERLIAETGFDVREVGFIQKDNSIAGGSPDGMIYDANGVPVVGVEIKCLKLDNHLAIVHKGEMPIKFKPQVHGSLSNTKLDAWLFVVYCPEAFPLDFRIIEITPDSYTKRIGEEVDQFVSDYKANWKQYLAEYEVDLLKKNTEAMAPVTYALLNQKVEQPTPTPKPTINLL